MSGSPSPLKAHAAQIRAYHSVMNIHYTLVIHWRGLTRALLGYFCITRPTGGGGGGGSILTYKLFARFSKFKSRVIALENFLSEKK